MKRLRWLPDRLPTTTCYCCETFHQFWCETFTVIAWLTNYDYWLLLRNFALVLVWNFYDDCLTAYDYLLFLRNFAPVLVWNFYGNCLTDRVRLLAFAAKLCTSSGVKLLRWLPDWPPTTTSFCCETLHQFWCETFTVIAWLTTYDYLLLLRNFAPVLVWDVYGDCLTDHVRLLAFAAKLLRWLSDDIPLWLLGYRKN